MKKILAIIIAVTILFSIALPVSAGAAAKVAGVKQSDASSTSISVSWSRYTNATKYKVEYADTANGPYKEDTSYNTDGSESIYSLFPGSTYYIRITPYVSGGWLNAAASDPIAVNTAPDSVTDIKQTKCTASSLTLGWSASSGATGYKIYTYTNSTETLVGSSKTTSFTLGKLSDKKEFSFDYIHVKAVRNTAGYDAESNYRYISKYDLTLTPQKGKAPKISSFYSYSNKIYFETPSLKFQDGYQFKVYKANSKKALKTLNDTTAFSSFKKGEAYKVQTRSYAKLNNGKKYGKWSKFTYFTAGLNDLRVTSKTQSSVKLAWKKVKGAKAKYDIYVSKKYNSGLKKFKKNFKGSSIRVTKCGKKRLSRNSYYYFYVKAKIKVGKKFKTSPIYSYIGQYTSY